MFRRGLNSHGKSRTPSKGSRQLRPLVRLKIATVLEAAVASGHPAGRMPIISKKHFVARISSWAKSALRIDIYLRRTYSGRPSFSIRLSDATAMATSVVCRPSVRERSASPITRL